MERSIKEGKKIPLGHESIIRNTNYFSCVTVNIKNIPESSWIEKSQEIKSMTLGRDRKDIRL